MQWYIYVGGTQQPGLIQADNWLAAVELWLLKNPGEHNGLVYAIGYIPYSRRRKQWKPTQTEKGDDNEHNEPR